MHLFKRQDAPCASVSFASALASYLQAYNFLKIYFLSSSHALKIQVTLTRDLCREQEDHRHHVSIPQPPYVIAVIGLGYRLFPCLHQLKRTRPFILAVRKARSRKNDICMCDLKGEKPVRIERKHQCFKAR
jgi:hypothetical protein